MKTTTAMMLEWNMKVQLYNMLYKLDIRDLSRLWEELQEVEE